MHKKIFLILLPIIGVFQAIGQSTVFSDSVLVSTKIWSRDAQRNIQYSDWKIFPSHTVNMLKGYAAVEANALNNYGGDAAVQLAATGFYRTQKVKGRWVVVDPSGHPFIVAAINGIRKGKSPNNEAAFNEKFGSEEKWMSTTIPSFQQMGFNTAGSWSDVTNIIQYNKTTNHPFAYTTQLSLLGTYAHAVAKKNPALKEASSLLFILDTAFADYCDEQGKKLALGKNDPNLLGHFSDNELSFTHTEFADILASSDKNNLCYLAAIQFMKDKSVDATTISKDQKEAFIGWLAGQYFKTVATAIKKYDPNHLYIGSRLHSSAKNNPHIFAAAHPYIDIISINYYGFWQLQQNHLQDWAQWSDKPFFITEFYTKGEDSQMGNKTGAGWLVKTQADRGIHYQNFCLELLKAKNCVGWHWFRYQDNDPNDPKANPSNADSNKGIINTNYDLYEKLAAPMKELNNNKYSLTKFFDKK